jgi:hypothetical protein
MEELEELNMTREGALNEVDLLYHDLSVCKSQLNKKSIRDHLELYVGVTSGPKKNNK